MTCHPAAREPTVRGVIYLFNYLFREARIHAGVALPVGELPMHGCLREQQVGRRSPAA
jgi:hypothetical protein